MNKGKIVEKLDDFYSDIADIKAEEIKLLDDLYEIAEWDSLTQARFASALENEFEISILPEEIICLSNYQETLKLLLSKIQTP